MWALLRLVLDGLALIVLVDAIASWIVPSRESFPRNWTSRVVDPLCAPIRRVLDPGRTGGLDLSPMILLLGLQLLRRVI